MLLFHQVKNGVLDMTTVVEMAKKVLNDETLVSNVRKVTAECGGITDSNRCELAYKMMVCSVEAAKKNGIKFRDFFLSDM